MNYHFIAIGGAVMHNLALELHAHGYGITGSDDEIFDPAKSRLEKAGILPPQYGWFPEKIHEGLDGIILGMHARENNPELIKARELNLKIYSFPEYIYEHAKNKTRIVIGGSHGKTTSTAMLMHVLNCHKIDFDYLVGSQLRGFDRMVKLSDAPLIVIEGDEYLTSALDPVPKFHRYLPHHAMITGIAWDHINVFPTFENYIEQFAGFIETIQPAGKCFYYQNDVELQKLALQYPKIMEPYDAPQFSLNKLGCTVVTEGKSFDLQIFGRHNLENAAGVQKLAQAAGISPSQFWQYLQSFEGTNKRLEKLYESDQFIVYQDFAHAPSKVTATVKAIKEQFPQHRILAMLELHTYSSLNPDFMPQYKDSLNPADASLVFYDPHVYELKKMEPVSSNYVKESFGGACEVFDKANDVKEWLKQQTSSPAYHPVVVLAMSSGKWAGLNMVDIITSA